MHVAENGNPIGIQIEHLHDGVLDALLCLPRQSIHEIDINRGYTVLTQPLDYPLRRLEALLAADCLLHRGVEVLHADGDTGHIGRDESFYFLRVHVAWVDFHGEFGRIVDDERVTQRRGDLADVTGSEDVGRAAAPMDVRHKVRSGEKRANAGDLALKRTQVANNGRIALSGLRVTTAVPAQAMAERNVHIKG